MLWQLMKDGNTGGLTFLRVLTQSLTLPVLILQEKLQNALQSIEPGTIKP